MDTDDINKKLGEISQWQKDHERHDDIRFKTIEERLKNIPTKDDIGDVVREAMADSILKAGKSAKVALITVATVIGAIAIIGGGFKWLLGWIGFTYIIK